MKEIIRTDKAPAPVGAYSQAVKVDCGRLLFVSGQIPLNPETKQVVGKTAAEQCERAMDNLAQILRQAGADFSAVIKTTIYLTDLNDFASVNDTYAAYFDTNPPARAAVQVSRLPMDVKIMIEAVAVV